MQKEKTEKNKGRFFYIVLLALVPISWGYGFVVTEDALLGGMGAFFLLACRFLLAGLLLLLVRFALVKRKGQTLARPFRKKECFWGLTLGVVNFFGFLLQTVGMKTTDPARTGMLTGAYVILVPLISCFLYKKFDYKAILNAFVFFIGMIFLADWKGGVVRTGDILCVCCSIFFAVQIICIESFGREWDAINFNVVQMLSMGGLGLIGAFIVGLDFAKIEWGKVIYPVLFLAVLSSALCYIIQTVAQRKVSASLTAIFLSLESVMSVVFGLAFERTAFTIPLLIGTIIMLGASISATIFDVDKRDLPQKENKE